MVTHNGSVVQGQLCERGRHVNHKKTSLARTHWSATIPSRKIAAHEGAFMSLFTRQSGGEFYQAKTAKTHTSNQ